MRTIYSGFREPRADVFLPIISLGWKRACAGAHNSNRCNKRITYFAVPTRWMLVNPHSWSRSLHGFPISPVIRLNWYERYITLYAIACFSLCVKIKRKKKQESERERETRKNCSAGTFVMHHVIQSNCFFRGSGCGAARRRIEGGRGGLGGDRWGKEGKWLVASRHTIKGNF